METENRITVTRLGEIRKMRMIAEGFRFFWNRVMKMF